MLCRQYAAFPSAAQQTTMTVINSTTAIMSSGGMTYGAVHVVSLISLHGRVIVYPVGHAEQMLHSRLDVNVLFANLSMYRTRNQHIKHGACKVSPTLPNSPSR
jgi:hypothetical protein